MEQKPSMGRIVIYNYPDKPVQSPAIVHSISIDGSVGLTIFGSGGVTTQSGVQEGPYAGQWNWPPRV